MTKDEAALIASATLDEAWPMVEYFSTIRRESAAEGNRAISAVVDRLRANGVPVTVHEPKLYLTVPKFGYVEAEGQPPAPAPRADDLAGAAGRRGAADLCREADRPAAGLWPAERGGVRPGLRSGARRRRREGQDRAVPRHDPVRAHQGFPRARRGRRDRDQSRQGRALGRRQSDLGHRRSRRPAVQARNSRRRGEQAGRRSADRARPQAAASAKLCTDFDEGWFKSLVPVVEIKGRSDKFVLLHGHYDSWHVGVGDNATGDACMLEVARMLWAQRDKLERSRAHRLVARPFDRPFRRLDLVRRQPSRAIWRRTASRT